MAEPDSQSTLAALFILSLLLNGLWVILRLCLKQANPTTLEEMLENNLGSERLQWALLLKRSPDNANWLIQMAYSITTLLMGVFGILGLPDLFLKMNVPTNWSLSLSILTLIISQLIFTTLIPHIIVQPQPEKILIKSFWIYAFLEKSLGPLATAVMIVTRALLKPFGISGLNFGGPTEDELRVLVEESNLEEDRAELVENALDFSGKTTKSIMVPRSEISYLSMDSPLDENLRYAKKSEHTRFPLVESDLDSTLSYVNIKDLLWLKESDPDQNVHLKSIARDVLCVPESKPIDDLLKEMQARRGHIAMVVDEFGSVTGLITLEDIIEELVGEIQDEHDEETPKIQRVNESVYLIDGVTTLEEIEDNLPVRFQHQSDDTIGGYVQTQLGKIASRGDFIEEGNYRLKVIETKKNRIIRLRLTIGLLEGDTDRSNGTRSSTENHTGSHFSKSFLSLIKSLHFTL